MENWKIIDENNNYEVSTEGNIRNKKTGKILKPWNAGKGYKMIWLGAGMKRYIHRLVGIAFLENINNCTDIDHIDRNKHNNKLQNLRWVTKQQNMWNQEHKNISGHSSGGFVINYSIGLNERYNKYFKNEDDAILHLEEIKIKYPRHI
jgi:hypothetical protein